MEQQVDLDQNHEREHTRTGMSVKAIKRAFLDNLFYLQGRFPDVAGQADYYRALAFTLTYTFVESLEKSYPFYTIRFIGGLVFLTGMLVMAYNTYKTVTAEDGSIQPQELS